MNKELIDSMMALLDDADEKYKAVLDDKNMSLEETRQKLLEIHFQRVHAIERIVKELVIASCGV